MTQVCEELRIGDLVGDTQRTVTLCSKIADAVPEDTFETWIAICHSSKSPHKYVVWDVIFRPNGRYACNGNYFLTMEEALQNYLERGGQ